MLTHCFPLYLPFVLFVILTVLMTVFGFFFIKSTNPAGNIPVLQFHPDLLRHLDFLEDPKTHGIGIIIMIKNSARKMMIKFFHDKNPINNFLCRSKENGAKKKQ